MLKLKFDIFQAKLKEDQRNGHYAQVHCMISNDSYTFIMRSKNKWEYYTVMLFEEILSFANAKDIDPMIAIDEFVINYCSNTIPIEEVEYQKILNSFDSPNDDQDNPKVEAENISVSKNSPPSLKDNSEEIDAGDDIVDEADDYSDFLLKFFNMLERQILKAAVHIETGRFGKFFEELFNVVNSIEFAKQVKKYVKQDLVTGMESAETELDKDIGFTESFEDKLNILASNQISGYTINGKLWPGIKGVTKEIQADVIKTVQEGVNDAIGIDGIKDNISKKFDKFSDWRSEMIARTETNRIINEGKILGYKESGIPGGKIVSVAVDARTSPICLRLHKRYGNNPIPLDDDFIDPETHKAFIAPPFHPNCRSSIVFRPD